MRKNLSVLLVVVVTIAGCTPVKPWEKENLAKPHMQLDAAPFAASFVHHVYESKEASSKGYSAGGGGCGCN